MSSIAGEAARESQTETTATAADEVLAQSESFIWVGLTTSKVSLPFGVSGTAKVSSVEGKVLALAGSLL
jgi:hypothetical protein